MKVVINTCFGGFGLSEAAIKLYCELRNMPVYKRGTGWDTWWVKCPVDVFDTLSDEEKDNMYFSEYSIERDDPILVQVVERLGQAANGMCAELTVVEIPDNVEWYIEEYDGKEHIAEVHRTWS